MLSLLPPPTQLPPLSMMLADLGGPDARAIGRALDVSARTARRWIAADHAPRGAMLALFWLTRWGRSQLDARLTSEAQGLAALVASLKRARTVDRRRVSRLLELADFGAANQPLLDTAEEYSFRGHGVTAVAGDCTARDHQPRHALPRAGHRTGDS